MILISVPGISKHGDRNELFCKEWSWKQMIKLNYNISLKMNSKSKGKTDSIKDFKSWK